MADDPVVDPRTAAQRARAEGQLLTEWADASEAFVEAKAKAMTRKHAEGKTYKDDPAYIATAEAMDKLRVYWRQVGEATPEGHPGHRNPVGVIKRGHR